MPTLSALVDGIMELIPYSSIIADHSRAFDAFFADFKSALEAYLEKHVVEGDDGAQCIEIEKEGNFCGKCRYFHTFNCDRGKLHLHTADPCGKYKEGE
jgi:hypothetical protein